MLAAGVQNIRTLKSHINHNFLPTLQLHNLQDIWARELFKPSEDAVKSNSSD